MKNNNNTTEQFYNYLRDKGLRENGIEELIDKITKGTPDRELYYQLEDFSKNKNCSSIIIRDKIQKEAEQKQKG